MTTEEIWLPVSDFPDKYEVSNLGRIKSLFWNNSKVQKVLSPYKMRNGYARVILGRKNMRSVHRLVALAFIPNPEGKPDVNHKNGNKFDNRSENLAWVTKSENQIHAFANGLQVNARGEDSVKFKITDLEIIAIHMMANSGKVEQLEIGNRFGIHRDTVSLIKHNKYKRALPSAA